MLVLSRRVGEAIVIDGGIRVSVASVQGGQVRLAIEAPRIVRIDREEVREQLDASEFQKPLSRLRSHSCKRTKQTAVATLF